MKEKLWYSQINKSWGNGIIVRLALQYILKGVLCAKMEGSKLKPCEKIKNSRKDNKSSITVF